MKISTVLTQSEPISFEEVEHGTEQMNELFEAWISGQDIPSAGMIVKEREVCAAVPGWHRYADNGEPVRYRYEYETVKVLYFRPPVTPKLMALAVEYLGQPNEYGEWVL